MWLCRAWRGDTRSEGGEVGGGGRGGDRGPGNRIAGDAGVKNMAWKAQHMQSDKDANRREQP